MKSQICLFRHRWHHRLHDRILSRWLWMANTAISSHPSRRRELYEIKQRILERYAIQTGHDWQRIRKPCWDCNGQGNDPYQPERRCDRCGGTGDYLTVYVMLERWEFAGRVFHRPVSRQFTRPTTAVNIDGFIRHPNLGPAGREAMLWLALSYDRRLFARLMRASMMCRIDLRYPLHTLNQIWFKASGWLKRYIPRRVRRSHCCMCGRRLWPWRRYCGAYCSHTCWNEIPF